MLWVEIEICGRKLQVINTHLGLTPPERASQAKVLCGPEWLGDPACRHPVILCGDFNTLPNSTVHNRLKDALKDEQDRRAFGRRTELTFPSHYPLVRFDHLFVSPDLTVESVEIPQNKLTKVASDHLPLVVTLRAP